MGFMIKDTTTLDLLAQLNLRFEPDSIVEIAALQREFEIFSTRRSLRDAFSLIGVLPTDQSERERWYDYLGHLRRYGSDLAGVNGHDRIVRALQENLEAAEPLPVAFTCHRAGDNDGVTVSRGQPHVFMLDTFLVVSFPTTPDANRGRRRQRHG